MNAAGVSSAHDVSPNSCGSQLGRTEKSWRRFVLVGLAVTTYGLAVTLGHLVLIAPEVRRLNGLLVAACLGFGGLAMAAARSRGARGLTVRWAVPLVALTAGWACVAGIVTWSYRATDMDGVAALFLRAVVDVFLVVLSLLAVARDWKAGALGLLPISLTWTAVFFGPSESTARRVRVELAARTLVKEAERVLEIRRRRRIWAVCRVRGVGRPSLHGRRVVGWLIAPGILDEGLGLVWATKASWSQTATPIRPTVIPGSYTAICATRSSTTGSTAARSFARVARAAAS
jgi:hypothetical protein